MSNVIPFHTREKLHPHAKRADIVGFLTHDLEQIRQKTLFLDYTFANGNKCRLVRYSNDKTDNFDAARSQALAEAGGIEREKSNGYVYVIGGSKFFEGDAKMDAYIKGMKQFCVEHHISLLDGGTETGIMQLNGEIRKQILAENAEAQELAAENDEEVTLWAPDLVGVMPFESASMNLERHADFAQEEDDHTVIYYVDSVKHDEDEWGSWGNESIPMTRDIYNPLIGDKPSAAVVYDGGGVAWKEVQANLASNRPIVAIKGTGRLADILASIAGGETEFVYKSNLLKERDQKVADLTAKANQKSETEGIGDDELTQIQAELEAEIKKVDQWQQNNLKLYQKVFDYFGQNLAKLHSIKVLDWSDTANATSDSLYEAMYDATTVPRESADLQVFDTKPTPQVEAA